LFSMFLAIIKLINSLFILKMRSLLLFFALFVIFIEQGFAAINYSVTPIKYELELQPGQSITLPASIRNNGPDVVTLPTTSSDFQSNGTSWTPSFVRKSELVFPDQQLSSWITIDEPSLTLNPWEEKATDFTINVPTTATPGGHYWAIFFKNDNSESSTSWNIWIHVDYGIIILVNVSWEVIVDVNIDPPIITWWAPVYDRCEWNDTSWSIYDGSCWDSEVTTWVVTWTWTEIWNEQDEESSNEGENTDGAWYVWTDENWDPEFEFPDNCPFGDFTPDRYDNICLEIPYPLGSNDTWDNDNQEPNNTIKDNNQDFTVDFQFPINNNGNTHVKPTGKIVLKDEDGKIIKAIWKETITNDRWAVIWEEIVDYIPINDSDWNVLPKTSRIFEAKWEGFPYKEYDDTWNQIVKYWSPSEYYTAKNKQEAGFLMFWERVSSVRQTKTITADIELFYDDKDWNPIEFTVAREFPVQYIEEQVTFNPYIIIGFILLFTIILLTWFAIRWWFLLFKKHKCWNCKETIKSHWETCPYCKTLQDKKKHRKFLEQKEVEITKTVKKRPIKKAATTVKKKRTTATKKSTTK